MELQEAWVRLTGLEGHSLSNKSFSDISLRHMDSIFLNCIYIFNVRMENALDLHIFFFFLSLKTHVPPTAASGW